MNRFRVREYAFLALFEWEMQGCRRPWIPDFSWAESAQDFAEVSLMVERIISDSPSLDGIIKSHLKGREIDLLGKVELSLLRLGVWSLKNLKTLDAPVVIAESLKLCKEYGEDKSHRFMNAILDSIHKSGKIN